MDFENVDELIREFNLQLEKRQDDMNLECWEKTSAALGYSAFNPEKDTCYDDVFKRADDEMYKTKKAMKALRS